MDQIYPLQGDQSSSNFDYLDNWVDKTIENEIQRGKKLQELKKNPTTRNNKFHVVSIGGTNIYREKKRNKRRSQSPKKLTRNVHNHFPYGINSPTMKVKPKKDSHRCSLRTAELAVPSKRHCIETWQNNYHILPGIMSPIPEELKEELQANNKVDHERLASKHISFSPIQQIDRLKQHVFDMTPIVRIPDAIECFERCKNAKRKKRKSEKARRKTKNMNSKDKRNLRKVEGDPKITTLKFKQSQNLCILFGHKIAKMLYRPAIITLNPKLEKISNIITMEIENLLRNGYKNEYRNFKNKRIEAEVIAKITVWISDILDETADKIIDDQLLDLDEEIGPVLDFLDDLVDKVVDICEPEPDILEISSSSETYNVESSTEYADNDDGDFELERKESKASLDLDIFIKKELDTILDSFDKDNVDDSLQDVEDNNNINNITEGRNNELDTEERTYTVNIPDKLPRHILKGTEYDTTDDTNPLEVNEQNEFQDANDNLGPAINDPENEESNADQGTEVNETINLESNEVDDDDLNKKVKFSEKGLVTNYDTAENDKSNSQKTDFMNPDIAFAEPNEHLLSDVDETWPKDLVSPVVRPSVSVSKSISSLGFVVEADERTSIMLVEDTRRYVLKETKQTINTDNVEAMPHQTEKDTGGKAADTYGEIEEGIKNESTEQSMINSSKDAQKIEMDLEQKAAEGISQRASIESIFISDISTKPITFETTLEKITEDEAAQAASQSQNTLEKAGGQSKDLENKERDKMSYDQATQASKPEKYKAETSDKTTNTSFSLIKREDKSTSVVSQSLADIAKHLPSGKFEFSSLRIKSKVDYKVNKDSAPAWVTQNFSEPSPKKSSDKHIRLWCKDLQTGFENLELWNEWLENTLGNVEIMERDKASIQIYESREEFIREWIHLKKNVDADVATWIKHSHSTQEKIKCFRKVYKNFQEPSSNIRTCNCNKK